MVRLMKNDDIDAVLNIWKSENIRAHSFIPKEYWERSFDFVKGALPKAEVYVYEENGRISGFIGLDGSYIEGIFVDSENHGKGIGTALLNRAKEIRGALILSVYRKNANAVRFYENRGFFIVNEGIDEVTGETEFEMVLK